MWSRIRLDIGWRDLFAGLLGTVFPGDRLSLQKGVEQQWSTGYDDALASLSVRSAFDLFLQAHAFPIETEILFSAITIPSMPEIARRHGLIPVPVDLEGENYHIDLAALRRAITPRTKAIVIAHLFGARADLSSIREIADEYSLVIIEDCAQAWNGWEWRGDESADISLFSFGTIKSATACGGALSRVRDREILSKMRKLQDQLPVQSSAKMFSRILKNILLKTMSLTWIYGALYSCAGRRFEGAMSQLTQGFPPGQLLERIRHQPSIGLLRLIRRRLNHYDIGRVRRRIQHATQINQLLGLDRQIDSNESADHCYWLFPLVVTHADQFVQRLRESGFDATQRGRLEVVDSSHDSDSVRCLQAKAMLDATVFLPCYPELTTSEINRMCRLIKQIDQDQAVIAQEKTGR